MQKEKLLVIIGSALALMVIGALALMVIGVILRGNPVEGMGSAASLVVNNSYSGQYLQRRDKNTSYNIVHDNETAEYFILDNYYNVGIFQSASEATVTLRRIPIAFNTSSIPDDATITSAYFQFRFVFDDYSSGKTDYFNITSGQPTYPHNPVSLVDYQYTYYTDDPIANSLLGSSMTHGAYYNITIPVNKLYTINKTGLTGYFLMMSKDISNESFSEGEKTNILFDTDQNDMDHEPKLYIYYDISTIPTTAFSCEPTTGTISFDTVCTDASTNSPTSWSWNVENGTVPKTSTVKNPIFNMSYPGTYNVNLSATNAYGTDWENKTAYITANSPSETITADFEANQTTGTRPLPVEFTDISTGPGITSWYWIFDGDNTSASEDPVWTYESSGTFNVNHSVSNATHTVWENKTAYITVSEPEVPVVGTDFIYGFGGNTRNWFEAVPVNFRDNSTILDPTSYYWEFGDGDTAAGPIAAHAYTASGTYQVNYGVTNATGTSWRNVSLPAITVWTPGWLPPWTDRKLHIINGTTHVNDTALDGYQQKIRIYNTTDTDSGNNIYMGNFSSANWDDLRITAADGNTTLPFAVYNTTEWFADVAVRLPFANNGTAIFIYTNNSAAASASDGQTTFDFYEDCSGATINTTKWFVVDNVTANSPTAGWCDIMSNSSAADSLTSRNPPWPIPRPGIFEFRGRSYHVSTAVGERIFHYQTDYARNWASIFALSTKLAYTSYNGTSVGTNTTRMKGWNAKSDNILEMQYDPIHRTSRWYINGTFDNDNVMKEPWGNIPTALNISFATYVNTAELAIDWVLVRKYANQTPMGYTTLPLEVNISGAPPVSAPVAAFSCIPLVTPRNGTVTCTDASTNTPTSWDWYSAARYTGGPTCFSGNKTNQNPVIFPMQWGYCELCEIATNAGGTDTECKGNYIYVRQP